jgi:hypothetical protein
MKYGQWQRIAMTTLVSLIFSSSVALPSAQDKGKSEKAKAEKEKDRKDHGDSLDVIAVASAGISIGYKDARDYAVASNLTGYKPLPPGIRKNLERGKPMPPGIAKTRLPSSYLSRLPAHEGYEWKVAGTDLVLVFEAGLTISGVLKDVFK